MSENTENKNPETPQDNPTPLDSEDNALKFSQKDLDKAVEARLAREKAKYHDYNDLKKQADEYSALKSKVGEYEAKIAKFGDIEGTLNEAYNDMLESIPEDKRTLIPESLSIKEKISYIKTNRNHLVNANAPLKPANTVPEVPKQQQKTTNEFGGYSSMAEWSIKDPIAYRKATRKI